MLSDRVKMSNFSVTVSLNIWRVTKEKDSSWLDTMVHLGYW